MTITEEIEKQVNAGFSANEIMTNLRTNGYTDKEINENLKAIKLAPAQTSGGRTPAVAIILLIVSIVRGTVWMSKGQTGLGVFFVCLGILGFVAYAYSR